MLQLHFLDHLYDTWDKVRGYLIEDLDYMQSAINAQFRVMHDDEGLINAPPGSKAATALNTAISNALGFTPTNTGPTGVIDTAEETVVFNGSVRNFGSAWRVAANAGSALESIGFAGAGFTAQGTATEIVDWRGTWLRETSAAIAGSAASLETSTPGLAAPNQSPFFRTRVRLGSVITAYRFWCGWFCQAVTSSGNHSPPDGDTLINNAANGNSVAIAFRFSTVAGDTGFVGIISDGGGDGAPPPAAGVQLETSNLGEAVLSTEYVLTIRVTANNDGTSATATFTVENAITGTISSQDISISAGMMTTMLANMATTTMSLAFMYVYTQDAVAKACDFRGMYYSAGQP